MPCNHSESTSEVRCTVCSDDLAVVVAEEVYTGPCRHEGSKGQLRCPTCSDDVPYVALEPGECRWCGGVFTVKGVSQHIWLKHAEVD